MTTDAPEEAAFRAEVQRFLASHAAEHSVTASPKVLSNTSPEAEAAHMEACRAWQRTLYDNGWAGLTWPKEFGGHGGPAWQQIIFNQELATYGMTSGFLGSTIGMVGPALMAHGTPEQQRQHLPPLLRGDVVWCQLFSEPEAGSDLANLRTSAVLDGEEWVVNGQKVWNSSAHLSDWAILLVRTDPDAPKHKGITFLLVDMSTPGIESRPLRQITGAAHFNEVFLSDVRIPKSNVVGEINAGWAPARTVLTNESIVIGGGAARDSASNLIALAQRRGQNTLPKIRQGLAQCYIKDRLLSWMGNRIQQDIRQGRRPSVDGSVLKVFWSENRRDKGNLAMAILGAEAMASGVSTDGAAGVSTDGLRFEAGTVSVAGVEEAEFWRTEMLNRFWGSIGGGTDEVHRNNMAERALGLPRDLRVDKDHPWRETSRGN